MNKVTLTDYEILLAASIGVQRRMESMTASRKNAHGFDGEHEWDVDIYGALAEKAFCKFMGWQWSGLVNTFKLPDCGANVQVRHTMLTAGCLIVRPNDADDEIFVLVTGRMPMFTVCGGLFGRDAKQRQYFKAYADRPGAYFVPQSSLKMLKTHGRDAHTMVQSSLGGRVRG